MADRNFVSSSSQYRSLGICAAVCLSMIVSACAGSRGGSIPYDVQDFGQPDTPSASTLADAYRIAPLDKLSISVFQVDDLSGEYTVDLTGHIAMPLLGNVRAVDLTPTELQSSLVVKLSEDYLRDPDITVGVIEAGGSLVTVEGSVSNPGQFPVFGNTTLLQVIARAGGPDDAANPKRVAIFRQIEGERMAAAFDLTTIRAGEDPDPEVFRGDIIVVDGSRARRAFKDVISSLPLANFFVPVF